MESRGDIVEDTRKIIFDVRHWIETLDEKTSIIRSSNKNTFR